MGCAKIKIWDTARKVGLDDLTLCAIAFLPIPIPTAFDPETPKIRPPPPITPPHHLMPMQSGIMPVPLHHQNRVGGRWGGADLNAFGCVQNELASTLG